nr:hypothetical protein [PVC group bacterium]
MDSPKAVEPTSRIRLAAAVITAFIVTASVTHSLMARRDVRRLRAELMAAHENQETLKAKADGAKGEASAARQEAEAAKNSVAELRDRLAQAQQEQVKVTRETTVANSNPGRDRHRTVCRSHLRQLGMALCMYAQQREGAYPTTLDELLPNYIDPKAEHLLRCPGDTNPIATPAGRACSFRYIGGPTFPRSPRAVIL